MIPRQRRQDEIIKFWVEINEKRKKFKNAIQRINENHFP